MSKLNQPFKLSTESNKKYYYCTCGQSTNLPFCNGAHKGTEFKPIIYENNQNITVYLCQCGKSSNKPLCDGSHVNDE